MPGLRAKLIEYLMGQDDDETPAATNGDGETLTAAEVARLREMMAKVDTAVPADNKSEGEGQHEAGRSAQPPEGARAALSLDDVKKMSASEIEANWDEVRKIVHNK